MVFEFGLHRLLEPVRIQAEPKQACQSYHGGPIVTFGWAGGSLSLSHRTASDRAWVRYHSTRRLRSRERHLLRHWVRETSHTCIPFIGAYAESFSSIQARALHVFARIWIETCPGLPVLRGSRGFTMYIQREKQFSAVVSNGKPVNSASPPMLHPAELIKHPCLLDYP